MKTSRRNRGRSLTGHRTSFATQSLARFPHCSESRLPSDGLGIPDWRRRRFTPLLMNGSYGRLPQSWSSIFRSEQLRGDRTFCPAVCNSVERPRECARLKGPEAPVDLLAVHHAEPNPNRFRHGKPFFGGRLVDPHCRHLSDVENGSNFTNQDDKDLAKFVTNYATSEPGIGEKFRYLSGP